jgi:serine/threonine-protein kinase
VSEQDVTAAPVASGGRYCPRCGTNTTAALCPNDGSPTFTHGLVGTPGFRIGDIISGRYRIQGVLGQGGFGAVYEAEHVVTGQAAAVKVMTGDNGQLSEQMVQRFLQEARVTARLIHPNTVRIYDFGQTEHGVLFMAMERLRGPTLEDRMAQGAVPQDEVVGIAVQVLRSLSEAHAAGLVHRDLKPANIILHEVPGEPSVVKVLDFGIARAGNSAITQTGVALGTPLFMSPEQGRGEALDLRTDVYALGCILYACVAGRPPFEDTNPVVILMKHQLDPLPDLHTTAKVPLTPAFIAVIRKATAKLPDERFASAQAMREALEALVGHGPAVRGDDNEPTRVYGLQAMPDDDASPSAPTATRPSEPGQRPSSARVRPPSRSQHPRPELAPEGPDERTAVALPAMVEAAVAAPPVRQRLASASQLPASTPVGRPPGDDPVTVVVQSRPPPRMLWASLAGVGVGLLAVAGWWLLQHTPDSRPPADGARSDEVAPGAAPSSDVKPAATTPAENKPAENKPAEDKPAAAQPDAGASPAGSRLSVPVEPAPAQEPKVGSAPAARSDGTAKSVPAAKPAAAVKPAPAAPQEPAAAEAKPAEAKPAKAKPAKSKPAKKNPNPFDTVD